MNFHRYKNGIILLKEIINSIRLSCGEDFKIWLKISHSDDRGLTIKKTISDLKQIESMVEAIEISYGTMEYALNIIRGKCPVDTVLEVNPLFNKYPKWIIPLWKKFFAPKYLKKFLPFTYNYNLDAALKIKENVNTKIFVTGGIRKLEDIQMILDKGIDRICLCRPFICEPNLVEKIKEGEWTESKCTNCNLCTINCDGLKFVRCYCN